ncbi:MAG: glycosyltransferase [Synergistaceae bacterium]|jgi:glycosyltransferase involved in cell wall biosynthesis|nr:glycosyltransferase [Synergistaceae bacterium]
MMKKFLIVFPSEWLAYSPTILNMVKLLSVCGQVDIVSFWDEKTSYVKTLEARVHFIKIPPMVFRVLAKLHLLRAYKLLSLLWVVFRKSRIKYDVSFGVDPLGFIAVRIFCGNPVFLSLEIEHNLWSEIAKTLRVSKLLIQSQERMEFMFGKDSKFRYWILPNSPIILPDMKQEFRKPKGHILYFGNICKKHGVEFCIDSLKLMSDDIKLTLHGIITGDYFYYLNKKYSELINNDRLCITSKYVEQADIHLYFNAFDIGLCLYDIEKSASPDFNYLSCPSGKMYDYFAAGLPVIGSNILGLQDVKIFSAGLLIDDYQPNTIIGAINHIYENYSRYSAASYKAGCHFDFRKFFLLILDDLYQ